MNKEYTDGKKVCYPAGCTKYQWYLCHCVL